MIQIPIRQYLISKGRVRWEKHFSFFIIYNLTVYLTAPHRQPFVPAIIMVSIIHIDIAEKRSDRAYSYGSRAAQLSLQAILKLSGEGNSVRVVEIHSSWNSKENGDECSNHDQTGSCSSPRIVPWREDTQRIVILVNRLTKVSSLLRVPPGGIGVAELSLNLRWVDVASILQPAVRFP